MPIKFLLTTALALFTTLLFAQNADSTLLRHSFRIDMGGGLNIPPQLSNATTSPTFGYKLSLSYDFWILPNWGIGSGASFSSWRSRSTNSNDFTTLNAIDKDGESYQHHTTLSSITERQSITSLDIPFRISFRTTPTRPFRLEANAWAGLAITTSTKFKVTGGSISTQGFYPQYNLTLYDMPVNGFYTISPRYDGDLTLRHTSLSAGAEVGISRALTPSVAIGVSSYVRHSFSNLRNSADRPQFDPDCLASDAYNPTYSSILTSAECPILRPTQVGIQLSLRLTLRRKRPSAPRPSQPASSRPSSVSPPPPATSVAPSLFIESPDDSLTIYRRSDTIPSPTDADLQQLVNQAGRMGFELGGSTLNDDSQATVRRIAALLSENPDYNVVVVGHTCNKGSDQVNMRVGFARARSVANALRRNGIPADRITISSAGAAHPIASNDTEDGRRKNRRAEVIVQRPE